MITSKYWLRLVRLTTFIGMISMGNQVNGNRRNRDNEPKEPLVVKTIDRHTGSSDEDRNILISNEFGENRPVVDDDKLLNTTDTLQLPYAPVSHQMDLIDFKQYRPDKILKSSKNALYVTRKEYLKKDWCKTEPLVQRIRETGCISRAVINRFCYGQCNSFYIPKSPKRSNMRMGHTVNRMAWLPDPTDMDLEPEDLTGPAFRSCGYCKPKKFTWVTVTLRCPSLIPQIRRKRIQKIKQCKCIAEPLD